MFRNLAVWVVDILAWTAGRIIDNRYVAQWIDEETAD